MKKLWITFFLILMSSGSLLADVEINLQRSVVVDSEYMKLSDIATVTGDNAEKIKKVFLGPSPRSGGSMTLLRSDITERLMDIGLGRGILFTGSLGVSVSRNIGAVEANKPVFADNTAEKSRSNEVIAKVEPGQGFGGSGKYAEYLQKVKEAETAEDVRQAIKEFVASKLGSNIQVVLQTTVNRFELDGSSKGLARVEGIERGKIPGRVTLAIVFTNQGQVAGYASVDATIDMQTELPVMARSIKKGEIVREQDVVIKRVDYKPGMALEQFVPKDINGRMALRSLREGMPVSAAYFGKPLDIEKGEMVTVLIQGNGFSIKEMALALGSGNSGDTIKVESVVSKNIYPVRVTGRNMADMPMNAL